jgi:hypothetical protein
MVHGEESARGSPRPVCKKERREGFIEQLLFEKVFEGLAGVGVARGCCRGRGTRSGRLSI